MNDLALPLRARAPRNGAVGAGYGAPAAPSEWQMADGRWQREKAIGALPGPGVETLTPEQPAARWQISKRTLRGLSRQEIFPHPFKVGGKFKRYHVWEVEAYERGELSEARRRRMLEPI